MGTPLGLQKPTHVGNGLLAKLSLHANLDSITFPHATSS